MLSDSNLGNDYTEGTFTFTGTPEIALTNVQVSTLTALEPCTATFTLENYGNTDVSILPIYFYYDDVYQYTYYVYDIWHNSIGPITFELPDGVDAGTHKLAFESTLADTDVLDDYTEGTFTWTADIDLTIDSIQRPSSLVAGLDSSIIGKVANYSGYSAATNFYVTMALDGSLWDGFIDFLPPMTLMYLNTEAPGSLLTAGPHSVQYTADYYHAVTETNEDNNTLPATYTWVAYDAPSGLTAVPGPTDGTIWLDWNPPSDTTYLQDYIALENGVPVAYPISNTIILPDYSEAGNYCFTVRAYYFDGYESYTSNDSNQACITTLTDTAQPPDAPALSVTVPANTNGDRLQLNWTVPASGNGPFTYDIYALTDSSAVTPYQYDFSDYPYGSGISYLDIGVEVGKTYYYVVQATDVDGVKSSPSNVASGSPLDTLVPNGPTNLVAYPDDGMIDLWWDWPITNEGGSSLYDLAGFYLYRSSCAYDEQGYITDCSPVEIVNVNPLWSNTYREYGLTNGREYTYYLTAVDNAGNESDYAVATAVVNPVDELPPDVSGLEIYSEENSLFLYWDSVVVEDLAAYNLYRGTETGQYTLHQTLQPWEHYFDDTSAVPGQVYYYVVRAVDAAEQESESGSNEVFGMIGEGAVEILSPTAGAPALITSGTNVVIEYRLNPDYLATVEGRATTLLHIANPEGLVVYRATDSSPTPSNPSGYNPNFNWNGQDMNGKDVLPGNYTSTIYLCTGDCPSEDMISQNYNDRAMEPDNMVSFRLEMTAYRPQTEGPNVGIPFQRLEIPNDLEEIPGAGIRVNGDIIEDAIEENDLIEVELEVYPFPVPSGLQYFLRRTNENIKVWDSRSMGTVLLDSGTEVPISFTSSLMAVWIENPNGGVADLELVAKDSLGNDVSADKVHFYPFTSVVIALGGETQDPPTTLEIDANYGTFQIAIDLYQQGYDVHMYNENVVEDEVNGGAAFAEVTNAVDNRNVTQVAIFGYSHGGGSTYDLAVNLNTNGYGVTYAAYVDAVAQPSLNPAQENRRPPPGTAFLVNYYQENGPFTLGGGPVPGANFELDVTRTLWGADLEHDDIDDNPNVMNGVMGQLTGHINP